MRIIVAVLVILLGSGHARADRPAAIAQDLHLAPDVGARVVGTLATYDAELYKLRTERGELRRQLLAEHTDSMSQTLLDNVIANEQALAQLDQNLLASLRAQLAPDQIVHVFMMLDASEPAAPSALPSQPTRPKSQKCNPFSQPHRCP